jgi:hypothetical protein
MHSYHVDPINVWRHVGDESIHIVLIPRISLSINYRADSRRIVGCHEG